MNNPLAIIYLLLTIAVSHTIYAQDTAAKKVKVPKHYFTPTFYSDYYRTPTTYFRNGRGLNNNPDQAAIAKQLRDYQYSQLTGGFYFPLVTTEKYHEDGRVSNFHLLATASYMVAMPRFSGIGNHNLLKASVGLRGIYNSGKKGIWFFDATPFMVGDLSTSGTMVSRWASTILYDRIVTPSFSYRVGITRTFILGNRFHLPYLGIRIGRLDKTYLSVQFPRFISLSFPMGSKFRGSFYTKASGNLLAMGNTDTLYNGTNGKSTEIDKTIIFGRYDGNTGMRLDFNPSSHISLYGAFGVCGVRGVAFYSNQYNAKKNADVLVPFFTQRVPGCLYFNLGLTIRIGRARSVYGNHNMYEVFNSNSTIDTGDNNTNTGDGNIPNETKKKTITNLRTRDIQDLIEAQDLY
ncbi:MAG: hypothetical protein ACXVNR_01570 [Bacteroidia bacterium]